MRYYPLFRTKVVFPSFLDRLLTTSHPTLRFKKNRRGVPISEGRFKKIAKNRNYPFWVFGGREEFLWVRHNKVLLKGVEGRKPFCKLSLFLLSEEFCFACVLGSPSWNLDSLFDDSFLRGFVPDGCYPSFQTGFVSTKIFLIFAEDLYSSFSAEQRFLKIVLKAR